MKKALLSLFMGFSLVFVATASAIAPSAPQVVTTFTPVELRIIDSDPHHVIIPAPTEIITPPPTVQPTLLPPKVKPTNPPVIILTPTYGWVHDSNVSWYGPGFYGHRTACGQTLTTTLLGVAHRTLPCGTLVDFRYNGITITVPVVDRGPYVTGRQWDLTGGLCLALHHCFTGALDYRIHK